MPDHDELSILTAKVVVLERLVRALLREQFSNASNPVVAAREYNDKFRRTLELAMANNPNDPAMITVIENARILLDQMCLEIEAQQDQGS